MLLKWIYDFFHRKRMTVQEMVPRVFSGNDREYATNFYTSWASEEYLEVQLGKGDHGLYDKQEFYDKAFFFFYSVPTDIGTFWVLGGDAESEMGMIVIEKYTNKVYYAYENTDPDTLTELAPSFRAFVEELRNAGWTPPMVSHVN
jgi:hypothetical protein